MRSRHPRVSWRDDSPATVYVCRRVLRTSREDLDFERGSSSYLRKGSRTVDCSPGLPVVDALIRPVRSILRSCCRRGRSWRLPHAIDPQVSERGAHRVGSGSPADAVHRRAGVVRRHHDRYSLVPKKAVKAAANTAGIPQTCVSTRCDIRSPLTSCSRVSTSGKSVPRSCQRRDDDDLYACCEGLAGPRGSTRCAARESTHLIASTGLPTSHVPRVPSLFGSAGLSIRGPAVLRRRLFLRCSDRRQGHLALGPTGRP